MKVSDLIKMLEQYPEDTRVIFKPYQSDYVEDVFYTCGMNDVRSFYGDDFDALTIYSDGQCGMI